jgi:hypothetical protein
MARLFALLAVAAAWTAGGCASDAPDYVVDGHGAVTGTVVSVADAPFGLVGSTLATGEGVAADHTPVPGNGNFGDYWCSRIGSHFRNMRHAAYTTKYLLLNANSDLPPYDQWYPDTLQRDLTTFHKTFDTFLFNYDWDDPYTN